LHEGGKPQPHAGAIPEEDGRVVVTDNFDSRPDFFIGLLMPMMEKVIPHHEPIAKVHRPRKCAPLVVSPQANDIATMRAKLVDQADGIGRRPAPIHNVAGKN
jgi:hypothetical protein